MIYFINYESNQLGNHELTAANQVAGFSKDLWLIHGNLYDLSGFLDKHPGGREWLEFTRGTDCSAEFETHHLDEEKVEKYLKTYYVGPCPNAARVKSYTFEPNGFYKTLKRAVFKELKEVGTGPTNQMKALSVLAIALWVISFAYLCLYPSFFKAIVAGLFLFPLMGIGHNFFHQKNSFWLYAWDMTCFSSHHWRISHAVSHHHFPVKFLSVCIPLC